MRTIEPCPACGSTQVLPLAFGYPTEAMNAQVRAGKLALGGCRCWGDERDPRWACRSCGLWWGEASAKIERAGLADLA
jgi:hypothetical protein